KLAPSFRNAKEMFERIETLMPQGPPWMSEKFVLPDAPNEPQTLWYRDIVECAAFLYGNPAIQDCMNYEGLRVFEPDGKTRVYHEFMTGEIMANLQVIPTGASPIGIIFASDETHLTNFSGNKTAHAVYMSIANIDKASRKKYSQGTWIPIAKIPVSKFAKTQFQTKTEQERMPGLLQSISFHKCMKVILRPLCDPVSHWHGQIMADPHGNLRRCLCFLVAWIADLKEQCLIAGVASNSCPKCFSDSTEFECAEASDRRTGQST
ncbi:uncharacterized protein EI90DRAFT_2879718, partial [Cantharellus anzutake]|uniref:uncharacterized protein n=1 Tax=Cantharellus anzutake TaxID=1750568 RepID=UPI001904F557